MIRITGVMARNTMTDDNSEISNRGGDASITNCHSSRVAAPSISPLVLTPKGFMTIDEWQVYQTRQTIEARKKARKRREQLARHAERRAEYLYRRDNEIRRAESIFSPSNDLTVMTDSNDL